MIKGPLSENGQQEKDQRGHVLSPDSYGLVLTFIIISIIVTATLPESPWALVIDIVALGITHLLALRTSREQVRTIRIGIAGLTASIVIVIIYAFVRIAQLRWIPEMSCALVIAITTIAVVRRLLTYPVINVAMVLGALCIYLLFGLFFTYLYATVGSLIPVPVFAEVKQASLSDYLYFSYITLTTVGYGDLTPGSGLARSLAVVEALTGQLYLVTVLALLVSKFGMARTRSDRDN